MLNIHVIVFERHSEAYLSYDIQFLLFPYEDATLTETGGKRVVIDVKFGKQDVVLLRGNSSLDSRRKGVFY